MFVYYAAHICPVLYKSVMSFMGWKIRTTRKNLHILHTYKNNASVTVLIITRSIRNRTNSQNYNEQMVRKTCNPSANLMMDENDAIMLCYKARKHYLPPYIQRHRTFSCLAVMLFGFWLFSCFCLKMFLTNEQRNAMYQKVSLQVLSKQRIVDSEDRQC